MTEMGAKPEAADFKHGLPLSAVSGNSWAEFKPARIGPIQPVDAGSGREDSARRAELGLGNASAGRGQCQITAAETERFFPYGSTEPRHTAHPVHGTGSEEERTECSAIS